MLNIVFVHGLQMLTVIDDRAKRARCQGAIETIIADGGSQFRCLPTSLDSW